MYEEERHFSWTNLFIKIIIVVIFILFTIWLLSLSVKSGTRGLSNSLSVLTDGIFSENIDKMKEVGKSYFTTERLPEKVGDIKTLTLAKMYDEDLILELKDKNGNACSAKNSYVVVEKMESEYQMKVYLECGEEKDSIKVIMGCYDYCNKDICEKKPEVVPVDANLEYEYSRTTGGYWTPYGAWSEWSKVSIDKTSYRDVETKTVKESYTYDKEVTETTYVGDASCPNVSGYTLSKKENGVCTYTKKVTSTEDPLSCADTYNGYKLVSQDGFTCNYSKKTTSTKDPLSCADTYNGYKLVSQDGFTCNYSKKTTSTKDPLACAKTYNGYTLVSQSGFTCNYSKPTTSTSDPLACAKTYNGYTLVSQSGFTCNYSKPGTTTISATPTTVGGGSHQECYQVPAGVTTVTPCAGCGVQVVTTYTTQCTTVSDPGYTVYTCPAGYTKSGTTCSKSTTLTTTTSVGCPSGYSKSGNSCVKSGTATTTTTVGCPSGYTKSGNICTKSVTKTTTKNAVCASGEKIEGNKCYKDVKTTKTVTEDRDVTYYRYRLREYVNGTTDYKWSTSNNDKSLLDAGYKLTGRTRSIGGK